MLQSLLRSVSLALFSLSGRRSVRRAERRSAMATATKNARTANQVVRGAGAVSKSTSMEFVIFEDNGGRYHWRIVAGNGGVLAQSEGLASYEDAQQAARHVRDGAASASFKPRAGGNEPVALVVRHAAAAHTQ
jgi:uncharacterized protein YegP (UPF0339 family)